jgi:heterodisulfide reductase subunit B
MVKEDKIEKAIKQAIELCGSSFQDVRHFLVKAKQELKKIKKKRERKQESAFQNWKFDINTNSLVNLSHEKRNSIIGNIEKMISDEVDKMKETKSKEIFND